MVFPIPYPFETIKSFSSINNLVLYTNADQFINKRDDLLSFIAGNEPQLPWFFLRFLMPIQDFIDTLNDYFSISMLLTLLASNTPHIFLLMKKV